MIRPRAADDFAVIRARIEELRRERTEASADANAQRLPPRPYQTASSGLQNADQRRLPAAIRQKLFREEARTVAQKPPFARRESG